MLIAASLAANGCVTRSGGSVARVEGTGEHVESVRWPHRGTEGVWLVVHRATNGVEVRHRLETPTASVFEIVVGPDVPFEVVFGLSGPTMNYRMWLSPEEAEQNRTRRIAEEIVFRRLIAVTSDRPAPHGAPHAARARTAYLIEPARTPPKGLCVVMPGAAGLTQADAGFYRLAARGWSVLMLLDEFDRELRVRSQPSASASGAPEALLDRLADAVDDALVEDAFIIEAMLEALAQDAPEIADRPLVLVGSSLGAIRLPATAARLEEARRRRSAQVPSVSAAVLIGGGAGVGDVLTASGLGRHWLGLAGIDLDAVDARDVARVLNERCAFAPERCAWALDGRPVLLMDARFDAIVPPRTADRLANALGKPTRWTYPLGHIGLFMLLGESEWSRVLDWIDAAAASGRSGRGAGS
ncbi:MAG TPA: hypothetical protein PKC43_12080 [Phycisphaerales bacterium]|nr:hypothetical protein [Phycisphaerales bacterium]HMP38170.1 hypothetical protein [Phycisphaerales bacterium]